MWGDNSFSAGGFRDYASGHMRLFRFDNKGSEKPGLVDEAGVFRDVSGFGSDYDEAFLGGDGLARLTEWGSSHLSKCPVVPEGSRIGPPVPRPSKIICINFQEPAILVNLILLKLITRFP